MSEPRDNDALLARLAELDLAAAEKAHARLMAAEEVSEIAELGRTYQRLSRCVRLTIALRAKLPPGDLKLITAVFVILALIMPRVPAYLKKWTARDA